MKKTASIIFFLLIVFNGFTNRNDNRWNINTNNEIIWNIDSNIPHYDHIEMSGEQISVVLRYGVNENGAFNLERSFIWPMLRTIPNNTHASLMRRFGWDIIGDMITINSSRLQKEIVKNITLNGIMIVQSEFELPGNGKIELIRNLFPSTQKPAFCEKYILKNTGQNHLAVEIPNAYSLIKTDSVKGVNGEYTIVAEVTGVNGQTLRPGDSLVFYSSFSAYKRNQTIEAINTEKELKARKEFITKLQENLILETPNKTINTMFSFAKIRASESIYNTKGGYMHSPGGESYYAAIWANDQAEYINPFFPFLGYEIGNKSAYNSFKHFARFINDEYKPIPSSIIAEGQDIWDGAGDRGDGAMIAYGVARYLLARGDKQEAIDLWPLLEWCLEYCKKKLNANGVVTSDSDELENRFPSGDANLTTSCLYFDALISASYLGDELKKPLSQIQGYREEAGVLLEAIEEFFGGTVEGFQTYKYYKENDVLRSWISVPLTVGIYDRKDETIKALFSPRLWTENGLLTQAGTETFWDRSTLYALRGVIDCGETDKGIEYLNHYSTQRLLGEHVPYAIEAWPEGNQRHLSAESGLYCRIITEGLFGIRPVGLKSFTFTPQLPENWDKMSLKNVRAFDSDFDLEVSRKGDKININIKVNNEYFLEKTINKNEQVLINL